MEKMGFVHKFTYINGGGTQKKKTAGGRLLLYLGE